MCVCLYVCGPQGKTVWDRYFVFQLLGMTPDIICKSLTRIRRQIPRWRTKLICSLLVRWCMPIIPSSSVPRVRDRRIINWCALYSLGGKQVINELVMFIKESLPFIASNKHISFMEKYEAPAILYDLPSLDIPRMYYSLPNIIKKINVNL